MSRGPTQAVAAAVAVAVGPAVGPGVGLGAVLAVDLLEGLPLVRARLVKSCHAT